MNQPGLGVSAPPSRLDVLGNVARTATAFVSAHLIVSLGSPWRGLVFLSLIGWLVACISPRVKWDRP